jgi:peptidoglycan/xylan/chitin deacetylase (PgdA/CDA1 family)
MYGKRVVWSIDDEQQVFLTFDDGPDPEITPKVLDILQQHDIKATFFCNGKNVEEYPAVYRQIIEHGHAVGNHTYDHLNGFQTRSADYIENVEKCSKLVISNIFRPPYGRIKPRQIKLLQANYTVVLWSVLSGDFDTRLHADDCTANVMKNLHKGAIIVYHDSKKAAPRMLESIHQVIIAIKQKNLTFGKLSAAAIRNTSDF